MMIDNRPGMSVEVDGSEAEERDHVRREIIDALDRRAVNGATLRQCWICERL